MKSRYLFQSSVWILQRNGLSYADEILKIGDYKTVANRSYYAVFSAMRAVLALDSFDSKKHSGIIAEFRRRYLKNEILMHLTEKQREVLLKNVVLDIPMEKIAQQMKIQENKVYKHKKNALSALAKRIKPDEI